MCAYVFAYARYILYNACVSLSLSLSLSLSNKISELTNTEVLINTKPREYDFPTEEIMLNYKCLSN